MNIRNGLFFAMTGFSIMACGSEATSGSGSCDRSLVCAQVITCIDGKEYPTACGPMNCDKPLGPCANDPTAPACDPSLICAQVVTCIDGQE